MSEFSKLGLSPALSAMADAIGYTTPTPIQKKAIPLVLEGRDVMGLAQTGTGKTAAFGLPLVQSLMSIDKRRERRTARSLILAPTRELANQIAANLRTYVENTHIKVTVVVGGASINIQRRKLEGGTDILVATPGRLLDLTNQKAVSLSQARFLVLDEADQMLDLGFIHDLRRIAKLLATPRQTLLFSATMPKQIEELAASYLSNPVRVEAAPPGQTADKVTQAVHFVERAGKIALLEDLLSKDMDSRSIVFARTKHGAEKLMKRLVSSGFEAASIHGNKSQGQRDRAIRNFKDGTIKVLVATDVAARGIDIPDVGHVYNFDLPEVPDAYVHRIGRTARAGADGKAVAFCAPDEINLLDAIERQTGILPEVASGERFELQRGGAKKPSRNRRGGGGGGNRGSQPARAKGGERKSSPGRPSRSVNPQRPKSTGNKNRNTRRPGAKRQSA